MAVYGSSVKYGDPLLAV